MLADLRAAALALVERTTAASGVPILVSDPAALDRIAALAAPEQRRRQTKRKAGRDVDPQPAAQRGTRDAATAS